MTRFFQNFQLQLPDAGELWEDTTGCCGNCGERLERCATHSWFFCACCGFVLLSSLPRLSTVLDFAIACVLFAHAVAPDACPPVDVGNPPVQVPVSSWSCFWRGLGEDYSFASSSSDVVFISLLRSLVLFLLFDYSLMHERQRKVINAIWAVALASTAFLLLKMAFRTERGGALVLLFWSLGSCWLSVFLHWMQRRRVVRLDQHRQREQSSRTAVPTVSPDAYHKLPHDDDALLDVRLSTDTAVNHSGGSGSNVVHSPSSPLLRFSNDHSGMLTPDEQLLAHPSSQWLDVDGVSVHYVLAQQQLHRHHRGVEEQFDCVLLHGFGGGAFTWYDALPALLGEAESPADSTLPCGFARVMAVDRVGFALSARPERMSQDSDNVTAPQGSSPSRPRTWSTATNANPYSDAFGVRVLEQLLRHVNSDTSPRRLVLVAHDTGAATALRFARRHAARVAAVVLASPSGGVPTVMRQFLGTSLGRPLIAQLVRSDLGDVTLRRAFYDPAEMPARVRRQYKAALRLPEWEKALFEVARAAEQESTDLRALLQQVLALRAKSDDVKHDSNSNDYTSANDSSESQVPRVLLLHGDSDRLVQVTQSEALASACPGVQLELMLRCGHLPHQEIPQRFARRVLQFVQPLRGDTARVDEPQMEQDTTPILSHRHPSTLSGY